jgi:hypothetical protein
MVLGMSNTYQQLVTALNVDEIRWVLSKKGDSRVGTKSPFAINDKSTGRLKHWLAWLLLITISLVRSVAVSHDKRLTILARAFSSQLPCWTFFICGATRYINIHCHWYCHIVRGELRRPRLLGCV